MFIQIQLQTVFYLFYLVCFISLAAASLLVNHYEKSVALMEKYLL